MFITCLTQLSRSTFTCQSSMFLLLEVCTACTSLMLSILLSLFVSGKNHLFMRYIRWLKYVRLARILKDPGVLALALFDYLIRRVDATYYHWFLWFAVQVWERGSWSHTHKYS